MNVTRLVQSLSPQQQRYFRLYSCLHVPEGCQTKYIQAFDAVLDGKRIRKADEPELFQIVLAVMRMYSSSGPVRDVRNMILDVEFLITKGMYDEARSILTRAEQGAAELELFGPQAEILNLRAELIQLSGFSKKLSVGQLLLDELALIERLENSARYRQYSLTLFEKIRAKGNLGVSEQLNYLRHVLKDPFMKSDERATTIRAKIIRLQMHATFHLLQGNNSEALSYQKKLLQLMSREPAQVKWKPFNYIILLNNFAITALRCKKYSDAKNAIEAMRRIPQQFTIRPSAELKAQMFSISSVLELDLLSKRGDIRLGAKRGERIIEEMKRHEKYITHSVQMTLRYNCGDLLFAAGDVMRAYTHFSILTQLPFTGVREDLKSAARLLQALCLYEARDTDHLSYAVINLKRQAKRQSPVYSSEIHLLNTLSKVIDADKSKQKVLWQKLSVKLEELQSNPLDAALYQNFDIPSWVEKQIKIGK